MCGELSFLLVMSDQQAGPAPKAPIKIAGSIPATNTALHPTPPAVQIRYAGNIG